jgi:hypothetical protein
MSEIGEKIAAKFKKPKADAEPILEVLRGVNPTMPVHEAKALLLELAEKARAL